MRIRRPWAEELAWLAASLVIAGVVIVQLDRLGVIPLYVVYLVGYVAYNRRMGVDLGPTEAIVRRPYRRAKRFGREDISAVTVERGFVTVRDAANRPTKLTVQNAVGNYGRQRAERTRRQIEQWVEQAPVATPHSVATVQTPGSASI